jgi:hypothetical protein
MSKTTRARASMGCHWGAEMRDWRLALVGIRAKEALGVGRRLTAVEDGEERRLTVAEEGWEKLEGGGVRGGRVARRMVEGLWAEWRRALGMRKEGAASSGGGCGSEKAASATGRVVEAK